MTRCSNNLVEITAALAIALSGCSSDEPSQACVPGEQRSCPCPGGETTGVQVCASDGSRLGPCSQCTTNDAGGASGSGGQGGSAGGSGTGGAPEGGIPDAGGAAGGADDAGTDGSEGGQPSCDGASTQPCGYCGVQTRECVDGEWSPWGACTQQGLCSPGTVESCGDVGTRTCSSECYWGDCVCSEETESQTCGNCGTQSRSCDAGTWSDWSACTGECGSLEQCFDDHQCVAMLVELPVGYAIDATEVTQSQYQAWLDTDPAVDQQPAFCAWNTSFVPSEGYFPAGQGQYPVVGIDWCDARAYCEAVGKRLCGQAGGGALLFDQWANAAASQWYAACSSVDQNAFPYGNEFDEAACNICDMEAPATVPAADFDTCQTDAGVFDLSGNVYEWEDACDGTAGEDDPCRIRGGSFYVVSVEYARCDGDATMPRSHSADAIGFRCCSP